MKKTVSIFIYLLVMGLAFAVPRNPHLQGTEVQTGSGIKVIYRAGTLQKPDGMALLRELDREVTFITTEELLNRYPNLTSHQRETAAAKEYGTPDAKVYTDYFLQEATMYMAL